MLFWRSLIAVDLFDLIFDLAWYAEHWRGLAGLALLIGGLFLATLVPGLIVAAIGFGFIIWEILTWFERRDS
jgi:hypothetical protein